MDARWPEIRALFDELVALDPSGRDSRLAEIEAGAPDLHAELGALLAADRDADARLRAHEDAAARGALAPAVPPRVDPLGLVGSEVGAYRVEGVLGAGGMGVVYRATDGSLGRAAALKFLPPGWSVDEAAKQRFLREARAASSLDHPNICTIYGAGEGPGGALYIAMAWYDGETLRARVDRGPVEIDEALDLATQIARGLSAAHARGLVHRDIKPANLLVMPRDAAGAGGTGSAPAATLKILDFGVAKVAGAALTLPDQRPGTAAYMAPEQVRGDPVDGRADLWALGVVLYEMLTGDRPPAATRRDHRPPPPSATRPEVPPAIDALVLGLLAPESADRPHSAEAVVAELERLRADPAAPMVGRKGRAIRTGVSRALGYAGLALLIALAAGGAYLWVQESRAPVTHAEATGRRFMAVLPFANTSPDAENEYFADGVTEDILAHLGQVPGFSLVSRTTAMRYKGTEKTLPEIAAELGVSYVLEGSVRRVDDQVRITARLVDGGADRPLWTETYDRRLEDIFAVQTDIARAIVTALEAELSGDLALRIGRRPTADLEAYDLFLLGRESLYRYDAEGIQRAMQLFERAVERDPTFTLARGWFARALAMYVHNRGLGPAWADSAVTAARRAIADQPDLPDAHTALGVALWVSGRYRDGVSAFERALDLNPNDAIATHNLGGLSSWRGDYDEAIRLTRRSLELEPTPSHQAYGNLAHSYAVLGLFDRAEAALDRALAVAPGSQGVLYSQARLELMRGRLDVATDVAVRLAEHGAESPSAAHDAAKVFILAGDPERARPAAEIAYGHSPVALRAYLVGVLYGYALLRTGEPARAGRVLAEAERYARDRIESGHESAALRYSLACIHSIRGDRDAAFLWLEQAIRFGWNGAAIASIDPLLENIRADERFPAALRAMETSLAPMRARVEREAL